MKFSLIICTHMRPKSLLQLLQSVQNQAVYPDEILIVDGSVNDETEIALNENRFCRVSYFLVPPDNRGLTKQRNYGIARVGNDMKIICFLDDDTVLENDYFEQLLKTYEFHPEAQGVGGYISNGCVYEFVGHDYDAKTDEYFFDGWKRKDGSRFIFRKKLGLDSDRPPGFSPAFSHGRSVSFLPPSGKIYEVEQLMGGVSSFKKEVFETLQFSTYFEGYGLYEDTDFALRVAQTGKLYVNTAAQLNHYHATSGRPNHYQYGKMVVRNGWYVWRVKNPKPTRLAKIKWHSITFLLIIMRFSNIFNTTKRMTAFKEATGRIVGWFSLLFHKPLRT